MTSVRGHKLVYVMTLGKAKCFGALCREEGGLGHCYQFVCVRGHVSLVISFAHFFNFIYMNLEYRNGGKIT